MKARNFSVRRAATLLALTLLAVVSGQGVAAHPLGNFTINHFARLSVGGERVSLRYVTDMAEIPTFQALQALGRDAGQPPPSSTELQAFSERAAAQSAQNIHLSVDGKSITLTPADSTARTLPGAGGLPTLRVECDFTAALPADLPGVAHRLRFEDDNTPDRIGWREIVIAQATGATVFNSSAFGNAVTDELKAYPQDMLTAPLSERAATLSWTKGAAPIGTTILRLRDGRPVAAPVRDRFAELIAVREITPGVALLGLLLAFLWGAGHAFSPGHGKTVVGAYLVGSRGTARHAAFLGLTVTITHTAGVFALGLITLFASRYVLPERLFPILTFVSGALVVAIGLSLFVQRLRAALGVADHAHEHDHSGNSMVPHSHGGRMHSHLPPGTDGGAVTWRSLLALGISGGLLPCPSALLVLLSAVALHRVGYGIVLVVAFSLGLAATLTGIGLAFLHAGRLLERSKSGLLSHPLLRYVPVFSALVITGVGAVICWQVIGPVFAPAITAAHAGQVSAEGGPAFASLSALAVLGLGLVFGLKHATEVDHVVAVSTIVSEHRNLWRSSLVGGLWGVGHTASLVVVGTIVLALRVAVPERVANWLEFGVALMIIGLGAAALARARRGSADVHVHPHRHEGISHTHIHFHDAETCHDVTQTGTAHAHPVRRVGLKPLVVGAVHGLAGSGALTLLVLTQIPSALVGFLYLAVFGLGSIVGMLLMSGLVGLPFALGARRPGGLSTTLQTVAGALSLAFGLWYAYHTGVTSGLLHTLSG